MSVAVLAVGLALAAILQDGILEDDVKKRVQAVFAEHFEKWADKKQWTRAAERGAGAIVAAKAPGYRKQLLQDLPQAVDYHSTLLEIHGHDEEDLEVGDFVIRGFKLSPDLKREGVEVHLDLLLARLTWAAKREWTDEKLKRILEQIEAIAETIRKVLRDMLPGDAAEEFVERQVGPLVRSWSSSLTGPFNVFMDSPLTAEQLETVRAEVRDAAKGFTPVALTEEDILDNERLKKLGIFKLIHNVREAGYKACGYCFSEFSALGEKVRQWEKKVKAKRDEHFKSQNPDKK